ncbi:integrase catalytic domain-containing protein [Trichonephila clavipes]|nr:integrase catalytic domain-containing protein [Trichonephila clavipes]
MLQELWKSKALWDDPIPSSILENWNKFTKESKYLNSISIPRFMGIDQNSDIILHGFCNASTKAYAAVVYLKSKQEIHLVSAKTRVAPIKQLTIPRLELCGALLLAELISVIQKALRTKPSYPKMGDLPKQIITQTRPFEIVGIDFAGPILTKCQHLRKANKFKSYICLFICLATKAVHLELVSTLSTDAMLAALRRFIARRGHPSEIHSDNGTNFIGANNYLKQLYMLSSIKLAKRHLIKTCKGNLLSFEELSTLLCQIEACINSRPLVPLSSDPEDIRALTPGHFLIGEPLLEIPESKSITNTSLSLSCRWKSLLKLRQHFWDRWHKEVLHHYQSGPKWKASQSEVQVGNLVLISDDNRPPLSWPMARILKLIPGTDRTNRVVILQTGSGLTRRSINKIVVLPVYTREDGDSEIHH